jgi:phage terminase large subunit-like protein
MTVATRRRAAPFTALHFERWTEELLLDNDQPWQLERFQRDFVRDLFKFQVCWAVWPEGNTKTTTLAGVALYHIEFKPTAYVAVAASSRDQAEWIYRQAEGFIFRNGLEDLTRSTAERCRTPHVFRCLEGYRRIRHDATGSRIQIFAADDRGGDGAIATLYLLDELHRHRDLALYRTWMGKIKKRQGKLAAISTAGEVGSEFELERTNFRRGGRVVRRGAHVRVEHPNAVLHEWALEEGADPDDLGAVVRCQPFSGITIDDLAEKRALPGMTPAHWARFTCNRPSRNDNSAIQEGEWHRAATSERIPAGQPVWLGLDLGWKYDTTAMVPLWIRDPEFRLFGPARILEPPRNGDQLDAHLVEAALHQIHAENPVHTVVMDMTNGAQLSQWVEETLGARVIDRTQVNSLACLDYARFMEALREGWLRHAGDAGLTAHALNAVARVLPQGDTKFERPRDSRTVRDELARRRVIDALVAAAMVHTTAAAELSRPEEPAFAWA